MPLHRTSMSEHETRTRDTRLPEDGSEQGEGKADALLHKTLVANIDVDRLPEDRADAIDHAFAESKEIRSYLNGKSSIESLRAVRNIVAERCSAAGLDEKDREEILAASDRRLEDIIRSCHDYGRAVNRLEHSKAARFALEEDKFAKTVASKDAARRRAHEALIDTLRIFNRFHSAVLHDRYRVDIPNSALVDDALLLDRNNAGQWALATDYYLRAKHLVELIRKKKEQKSSAPPEEQAA